MRLIPKNWSSFQHYKDRSPPWIKLHKGLIDDRAYQRLPVASRALAPMLWLLASESKDGSFDGDVVELSFRLRASEKEVSQGLDPLVKAGFFCLAQDASKPLADGVQVAAPEGETEREGEAEEEREGESSGTPVPAEPPVIEFPLIDGSEHAVTKADCMEWEAAYPGVDVMQQLRQMRAWCKANPANRKTTKGINAFVVKWLTKAQDNSGGNAGRAPINRQQALEDHNYQVGQAWAKGGSDAPH